MMKSVYKLALQTTIPVLCGLVVVNAFLVAKNLKLIQNSVAMRAGAAKAHAHVSDVTLDLQTMETSQRGYLLTGDPLYLKPYGEASERLSAHLAELRSTLAGQDHEQEAQLESVVQAKREEMQETIRLRQQGYRHRAFVITGSNRGQQLMEQARTLLDGLAASQSSAIGGYDADFKASVGKAIRESALASAILLAMAVVTFFAFHQYRSRLELGYARHDEELRETRGRLERLSSTMFHDCRAQLAEIQESASSLLDQFGGFLPRQGHERLEWIEGGAARMVASLDAVPGAPEQKAAGNVERLSA